MAQRFCEVALPVPLRSTFTYAVPASLHGEELVGRRVVVPFRNRAMVGVGLAESSRAPEIAGGKKSIKEIVELMDTVPALPPKLIELGQWLSRYYVAPIGETLRAMLPPEIELRHDREYSLTDRGRGYLEELGVARGDYRGRSGRASVSAKGRGQRRFRFHHRKFGGGSAAKQPRNASSVSVT